MKEVIKKILYVLVGILGIVMIAMYAPKEAIPPTISGVAFILIAITGFLK